MSVNTPCDDEVVSEENVEPENEPQPAPRAKVRRSSRIHRALGWHQDYTTANATSSLNTNPTSNTT